MTIPPTATKSFICLAMFLLCVTARSQTVEPTPEVEKIADSAMEEGLTYPQRLENAKLGIDKAVSLKDKAGEALCTFLAGRWLVELSRFKEAKGYLYRSLALAKEIHQRRNEGLDYIFLARADYALHNTTAAVNDSESVLPILIELNDRDVELVVYNNLVAFYSELGRFDKLTDTLGRLIDLLKGFPDKKSELAAAISAQGNAQFRLKQWSAGIENFNIASSAFEELKDQKSYIICQTNIAMGLDKLNQTSAAIALLEKNKKAAQAGKDFESWMTLCLNEVGIFRGRGRLKDSITLLTSDLLTQSSDLPPGIIAGLHNLIGNDLVDLGQLEAAQEHFLEALKIGQLAKDISIQGVALNNIGLANYKAGHASEAVDYFKQAEPLLQASGQVEIAMFCLGNLGLAQNSLGHQEEALSDFNQSLAYFRKQQNQVAIGRLLDNLGVVYRDLHLFNLALRSFKEALPLIKDSYDANLILEVEQNLGLALADTGRSNDALAQLKVAASDAKRYGYKPTLALITNNIGLVYQAQGKYVLSLNNFESAYSVAKTCDLRTTGIILNNEAIMLYRFGKKASSFQCLNKALRIAISIADQDSEVNALTNLAYQYKLSSSLGKAILFGKAGVNAREKQKQELRNFSQDFQKAYATAISSPYRDLADWLIEAGRISEAEEVLGLLKDHEYNNFLHVRAGSRQELVDLTPLEANWIKQYDRLGEDLAAASAERDALLKMPANLRTSKEIQQLVELRKKSDLAAAAFEAFLVQADKAFKDAKAEDSRLKDLRGAQALQSVLRELPKHPAAIYTLLTADSVRVILSVPGLNITRQAAKKVAFANLNHKILQFRLALKDPNYDPRPLGAELYDLVIRPIERDLEASHSQTLMWSLDGPLRYIPIWALYDRQTKKYLIEKYPSSLFTPHTVDRLIQTPKSWTGVEFGITKDEAVGKTNFSALPDVEQELNGVHKALGGEQPILDDKFTYETFRDELDKGPHVVHIATHFNFQPSDDEGSFLLLGKGDTLSLDKLKKMEDGAFSSVDLLVLSACETAVSANADGSEFEGFALLAQLKGASAVLATLWPVADESTSILMSEFYSARKLHPEWTKLQALRSVQLKMLHGEITGKSSVVRTGESTKPADSIESPLWPKDQPTFAHPYYWAPFVLTGNWK